MMSSDLTEAKQCLLDKLGPNYGIYIQLLGKWFRGLISKEDFDASAKHLIKQNFVFEHNKFWLAFFHHCANSASNSLQGHNFQLNDTSLYGQKTLDYDYGNEEYRRSPDSTSTSLYISNSTTLGTKVRCLPSKVITHMKIFVIAWEMGLDSANDNVSLYINLALQHFLKNIITELICTKTAYRMRENRFKYAIGVKSINPYLSNSLKIYSSNLEYDPYQIESNKMNSSLVDTYAYNDSLFPSRLYETQALYEYACSTSSLSSPTSRRTKRLKLSEFILNQAEDLREPVECQEEQVEKDGNSGENLNHAQEFLPNGLTSQNTGFEGKNSEEDATPVEKSEGSERKLTLVHLLIAFLSNRTIIPSQSLYSINLERIFTKLS